MVEAISMAPPATTTRVDVAPSARATDERGQECVAIDIGISTGIRRECVGRTLGLDQTLIRKAPTQALAISAREPVHRAKAAVKSPGPPCPGALAGVAMPALPLISIAPAMRTSPDARIHTGVLSGFLLKLRTVFVLPLLLWTVV